LSHPTSPSVQGFNEPDFVNEANIQIQDATALWKEFIQPLKQYDIRLGGPAVTATSTGKQWLTEFLSACNQCSIDFLPLHWWVSPAEGSLLGNAWACSIVFRYGSGTGGFYDYIWDMHSSFPQFPIWITEYADVSHNKTGGFLFNKAILRGGLSYYSCVLIRGLGFHESNHQLSGFIGLD